MQLPSISDSCTHIYSVGFYSQIFHILGQFPNALSHSPYLMLISYSLRKHYEAVIL